MEKLNPYSLNINTSENDLQEIVDLIESYRITSDFLYWLSDDECKRYSVFKEMNKETDVRVVQFYIDNFLVLTMRSELFLRKVAAETFPILTARAIPSLDQILSCKIRKDPISKIVAAPYYYVISRVYQEEEECGVVWDIFELPRLAAIYKTRKDMGLKESDLLSSEVVQL